jgi:hypothetical protein
MPTLTPEERAEMDALPATPPLDHLPEATHL